MGRDGLPSGALHWHPLPSSPVTIHPPKGADIRHPSCSAPILLNI